MGKKAGWMLSGRERHDLAGEVEGLGGKAGTSDKCGCWVLWFVCHGILASKGTARGYFIGRGGGGGDSVMNDGVYGSSGGGSGGGGV